MSELVSIVYRPKDAAASEAGYTRVPLQQARLVDAYGIEGDEKGGGPDRHLNIMAAETLQALAGEGFHAAPGQMGEQLIIAGLAVDSLPAGARLQIGESACVEVVEPRTGCAKFERHQGRQREEAAERLGVMARVVAGGPIRVGDPVRLLVEAGSQERSARTLASGLPFTGSVSGRADIGVPGDTNSLTPKSAPVVSSPSRAPRKQNDATMAPGPSSHRPGRIIRRRGRRM